MASSKKSRAIGLEIDNGAARAVEMTGKAGAPNLATLGAVSLPGGAVKEGLIYEPNLVGEALKKLWQKVGFSSREVFLGVSNQGVLVRHITIPKVPANKLKNVITFQAQEHLPIPLQSVVMDYKVLGETAGSGEAESGLEILLVAARKEMLDKFLEALTIARLEPVDIDASSMVLISLLPDKAVKMNLLLVNVANGLNNILVSAKGKPRLARLGLAKINDLADSLGCSLDETFRITSNDDRASSILTGWLNNLAIELRSSLTYYQDQPDSLPVEGVLLSGSGALCHGITKHLEDYLDLPVRIFNPLKEYNPAKRRLVRSDIEAAEYAVSAGLAVRGLEG